LDFTTAFQESDMTTITRKQFEAAVRAYQNGADVGGVIRAAGITIADPEPPEEMVKLAREIADNLEAKFSPALPLAYQGALATLQHVEKVVLEEDTNWGKGRSAKVALKRLLTELGARHDNER
jgi:hypothetical protein